MSDKLQITDEELLQYIRNNSIINLADVQKKIEMKKRNDLLAMHEYKIYQGSDGKWYTYLPDEDKGRKKIKRTTQKALEDSVIQYYKSKQERPKTFDDMYHHWRSVQDVTVSNNTTAKYNTDYKRYFANSEFSQKLIANITEEDVKVFLCSTIKRLNLCKKACKTLFGYMNNVFKSARMNRVITENPMQYLVAKQFYKYCTEKERPKEKVLVSNEDKIKLNLRFREDYQKKPSYIPTYAVELASLIGMRAGELSALTWDSIHENYLIIDKSEKYDRIRKEYFIDKTKNKKIRSFPITPPIKDLLERVKKAEIEQGYICEWVFADKNGRIHAPVISSCIKNKCRQVGITEKGIHAYRRTVNSEMRRNGVSSTVAASLLGHTEAVNDKYYTFDVTDMNEKAEIVSRVNEKMQRIS